MNTAVNEPWRAAAPPARPFGHLEMPADVVETMPSGAVLHRCAGGDQPVCRLAMQIPGGFAEIGAERARLLAMMLTEGCRDYDADAFADELDYYGVRLAVRADAHFILVEAAMLSNVLPQALPLLTAAFAEPLFASGRLAVAQTQLCNVIDMELADPAAIAERGMLPLIMGGGHPLAAMPDKERVRAITGSDLRQAYGGIFAPAGIHAYLSGRADDNIVQSVREFLDTLPVLGHGCGLNIVPFTPAPSGTYPCASAASPQQCAISAALPAIRRIHPDYVPLRYAVMALGGYFGSRLNANIREDKGLTYGITASLLGYLDDSYIQIATRTDRRNQALVTEEICSELRRMATAPPMGSELERFRRFAATELAELLDNSSSVMRYYGSINLLGSTADYFDRQQHVLAALTPDAIAEISARYLQPELLRISVC